MADPDVWNQLKLAFLPLTNPTAVDAPLFSLFPLYASARVALDSSPTLDFEGLGGNAPFRGRWGVSDLRDLDER